ncbi:MAG: hypothetical protein HY043_04100 [Verrucomicrobia bacterium]|nr:hypothetical protein [Verrucomicrobiota bacterium]
MLAGVIGVPRAGLLPQALAQAAPNQIYSHGEPTPEEQLMLELVNRARANPTAEAARFGIDLNEGITTDPLSPDPKQPLAFNAQLIAAARGHSQWMLDNDVFDHFETGGIGPGDRIQAAGYVLSGSWTYGENIAWQGQTGGSPPVGPTVTAEEQGLFVDEDIPGRGHRENLMRGAFREIGIGVKTGVFSTQGFDLNTVMATQDFGTTGANPGPLLIGVVYRDANGDGAYSVGEGVAGVTVTPASGTFYALTSTSGGYAIPVGRTSGTLQVTFSGGTLGAPVTRTVTLSQQNLKLDLETISGVPVTLGFVAGSARVTPGGFFEADVYGPANASVSIQTSDDLLNWTLAATIKLTGAATHFTDTKSGTHSRRFYRAVKN